MKARHGRRHGRSESEMRGTSVRVAWAGVVLTLAAVVGAMFIDSRWPEGLRVLSVYAVAATGIAGVLALGLAQLLKDNEL